MKELVWRWGSLKGRLTTRGGEEASRQVMSGGCNDVGLVVQRVVQLGRYSTINCLQLE